MPYICCAYLFFHPSPTVITMRLLTRPGLSVSSLSLLLLFSSCRSYQSYLQQAMMGQNADLTLAKNSTATLLASVSPSPGVSVADGTALYYVSGGPGTLRLERFSPSLGVEWMQEADMKGMNFNMEAYPLKNGRILTVLLEKDDQEIAFDGVLFEGTKAPAMPEKRLATLSANVPNYGSLVLSPARDRFALMKWDYTFTGKLTLEGVIYDDSFSPLDTFRQTCPIKSPNDSVYDVLLHDDGAVVIRGGSYAGGPGLVADVTDGSGNSVRTINLPFPTPTDEKPRLAGSVTASFAPDGMLLLAAGINSGRELKEVMFRRIDCRTGEVKGEESIAITPETAKELSGSKKIEDTRLHTILADAEGRVFVVAEEMRTVKEKESDTKTSQSPITGAKSTTTFNFGEFYKTYFGNIMVFAFDAAGKRMWSRQVLDKDRLTSSAPAAMWEALPFRFIHRFENAGRCPASLRAGKCTILYSDMTSTGYVDIDPANIVPPKPTPLVEVTGTVSGRNFRWTDDTTLVISATLGYRNARLMRLHVP